MASNPEPQSNDQRVIDSEAMSWVLTHYFGDLTQEQKHSFDIWYNTSEEHRKAYVRAERLWEGIQEADTLKTDAVNMPANDVIDDMANTIHKLSVTNTSVSSEDVEGKQRDSSANGLPPDRREQEKGNLDDYFEYLKPLCFAAIISLAIVLFAHFVL